MHRTENQDHGALQDHLASLDPRDHPENLACPPLQKHLSLESPERLATKEHLDHLARPEHQEPTAHQDHLGQRESRDQMERQVPMASPDQLVPPDRLACPARRVSAPSTAQSTVVCSSRTAHGAKLLLEVDNRMAFLVVAADCLLLFLFHLQSGSINDNKKAFCFPPTANLLLTNRRHQSQQLNMAADPMLVDANVHLCFPPPTTLPLPVFSLLLLPPPSPTFILLSAYCSLFL